MTDFSSTMPRRLAPCSLLFMGLLTGMLALLHPLPVYATSASHPDANTIDLPATGANASLDVAHFAPFASTAHAVRLRIDGSDAITGLEFGAVAAMSPLSATTYSVAVVPEVLGTVAISQSITLTDSEDYTLAAIGNGSYQDLELLLLVDGPPAAVPDATVQATVRLAHVAPFTSTLAATRLDLCTDAGAPLVRALAYKAVTYVHFEPGMHNLMLAYGGSDCATSAFDLPSLTVSGDEYVELYLIGDNAVQPLQLAATTPVPYTPAPAVAKIAHFAPFADSAALSITVRIDGNSVVPALGYGASTADLLLDPGEHLVEILWPVQAARGNGVIISDTIALASGQEYTLAAIGNGTLQELQLLLFEDKPTAGGLQGVWANMAPDGAATQGADRTAAVLGAAPQPQLRIAHVAPLAAQASAMHLDLCTDAGVLVFSDLDYREVHVLGFVPGIYNLKLVAAGDSCGAAVIDIPPLDLAQDVYVELYAIGDITHQPAAFAATTEVPLPPVLAPRLHMPAVLR